MPISRRTFLLTPVIAASFPARGRAAEGATGPAAVIQHFYDDLLAVMKEAKHLSFDERYQRLAPTVARTFELALMTRLSVGPEWPQLRPDQQQHLTEALTRYTVSVYASRFDDFNGERFEVDAAAPPGPNGVVVPSRLIKSNGEKVPLNYLMRQGAGGLWQAIDIYLSGTISELASRRSEFVAVLHQSGADGLIQLLEQRTAAQRAG